MHITKHTIAKILFRSGFASIFLINSVVAIASPDSFAELIEKNIIGQYFPGVVVVSMVIFIALNDLVLGVLILSGKFRYFVYIWSGLWLLTIAGIKLTNLIWVID